jgi:hypothetical protein
MKSDVQFTVGSNSEKAIQDLAKLISKHEDLLAKIKDVNTHGKSASGMFAEMGKSINRIVPDITAIAAGVFSANTAMQIFSKSLELIKAEFEDIRRKQEEAGRTTMTVVERYGSWQNP